MYNIAFKLAVEAKELSLSKYDPLLNWKTEITFGGSKLKSFFNLIFLIVEERIIEKAGGGICM
jgi:hypothetical protein